MGVWFTIGFTTWLVSTSGSPNLDVRCRLQSSWLPFHHAEVALPRRGHHEHWKLAPYGAPFRHPRHGWYPWDLRFFWSGTRSEQRPEVISKVETHSACVVGKKDVQHDACSTMLMCDYSGTNNKMLIVSVVWWAKVGQLTRYYDVLCKTWTVE
jgi:hypothetical protein